MMITIEPSEEELQERKEVLAKIKPWIAVSLLFCNHNIIGMLFDHFAGIQRSRLEPLPHAYQYYSGRSRIALHRRTAELRIRL